MSDSSCASTTSPMDKRILANSIIRAKMLQNIKWEDDNAGDESESVQS